MIALSRGHQINYDCDYSFDCETAALYVQKYFWCRMSVSVHKIIMLQSLKLYSYLLVSCLKMHKKPVIKYTEEFTKNILEKVSDLIQLRI